jgi:hypothetical protein
MNKPTRKEMKAILQHPGTDAATRERYIVMYREAFMRDLRGLIAAWGDIRPGRVGGVLEDCGNNIKLVITTLIEELTDGNEAVSGPGRGDSHPGDGNACAGHDGGS